MSTAETLPHPPPAPPPASEAELPLFRSEALARQQSNWLGSVLLAPRLSHKVFTGFAAVAIVAVLALLFWGQYTRKAHLNGWLVPQAGVIRVFAPQSGVVAQLNVHEGDEVEKGARLATVSTELRTQALGATREQVVRTLQTRRDSTATEKDRLRQLHQEQRAELQQRLASKSAEESHLEEEINLQRARNDLAVVNLGRQRELRQRQLAVEQRVQQAEEDRLDQAIRLQGLIRTRQNLAQERFAIETQLRELPLKQQTQLAEVDRTLAALDQQLLEAEAQREAILVAPQSGTVTAVQAQAGGAVGTTTPLLSILPAGSDLQAQLFSTSRGIGFIRPGQRVLLRYAAFPYQKFGYYEGTVSEVSRSAVAPGELPPSLAGLSSLFGANEPVYQVTVRLKSQSAMAYGAPTPLHAGMQLEADVMLERRRLIEWVFDPLFALAGGAAR